MCLYFVGFAAQICVITSVTCCPLPVEQSINDAAFDNVKEMMPVYSLYLNESDRSLFPNYGKFCVSLGSIGCIIMHAYSYIVYLRICVMCAFMHVPRV